MPLSLPSLHIPTSGSAINIITINKTKPQACVSVCAASQSRRFLLHLFVLISQAFCSPYLLAWCNYQKWSKAPYQQANQSHVRCSKSIPSNATDKTLPLQGRGSFCFTWGGTKGHRIAMSSRISSVVLSEWFKQRKRVWNQTGNLGTAPFLARISAYPGKHYSISFSLSIHPSVRKYGKGRGSGRKIWAIPDMSTCMHPFWPLSQLVSFLWTIVCMMQQQDKKCLPCSAFVSTDKKPFGGGGGGSVIQSTGNIIPRLNRSSSHAC